MRLALFLSMMASVCLALDTPVVTTFEADPYAIVQPDLRGRVESIKVADDGRTADIYVSFSKEPTAAPSMEFRFTGTKKAVSVFAGEEQCSWPSKEQGNYNTYRYTITLPEAVNAKRITPSRRVRFGGALRNFESGQLLLVSDAGVRRGRTWSGLIGGKHYDFRGGVLVDPAMALAPQPMMRSRMMAAPMTPQPQRIAFDISPKPKPEPIEEPNWDDYPLTPPPYYDGQETK